MAQLSSSRANTFLASPIPGKIISILAQEGEKVQAGQRVFIVESMKMLHELRVPRQGNILGIRGRVGDVVQPDNHLAYIL